MTNQEKKAMNVAKRAHTSQIKKAALLAVPYVEAAHEAALEENVVFNQLLLTHKEICAQRRASAYETTSIFTKSINEGSSCYQLECLLTEFRTENELVRMMNTATMLKKCGTEEVKRSRIRSHLSHLKRKFNHTVKYIEKIEGHLVYFKFELK